MNPRAAIVAGAAFCLVGCGPSVETLIKGDAEALAVGPQAKVSDIPPEVELGRKPVPLQWPGNFLYVRLPGSPPRAESLPIIGLAETRLPGRDWIPASVYPIGTRGLTVELPTSLAVTDSLDVRVCLPGRKASTFRLHRPPTLPDRPSPGRLSVPARAISDGKRGAAVIRPQPAPGEIVIIESLSASPPNFESGVTHPEIVPRAGEATGIFMPDAGGMRAVDVKAEIGYYRVAKEGFGMAERLPARSPDGETRILIRGKDRWESPQGRHWSGMVNFRVLQRIRQEATHGRIEVVRGTFDAFPFDPRHPSASGLIEWKPKEADLHFGPSVGETGIDPSR